jgi:hypothetical protein
MSMDKRYWIARCQHGEDGAISTYPSTREEFEQKCCFCSHLKDDTVSISEMTTEEFARKLEEMPPWMKPLLELRKEATRKIFASLRDVKYDDIPCATLEKWRLRLSVDHGDGPFMFHLSARHVDKGTNVTEKELEILSEFLLSLGAVPLPSSIFSLEAFHFRWPALDVGDEDLN